MPLYLVPVPIGNLKDITLRAIETLKEVDYILAEDTRTTGKLLKAHAIDTPMKAFHAHNEHQTLHQWVEELEAGKKMAQVSDAGTPGISDPGFLLVRAALEAGIQVESLPGPSALLPALTASGLPCDRFVFEGFLPHKKGRKTKLEALAKEERTIVLYESPYRIVKTLKQIESHFGPDRQVAIAREITKLYEEYLRGTAQEVRKQLEQGKPRGEFVLCIAGKD